MDTATPQTAHDEQMQEIKEQTAPKPAKRHSKWWGIGVALAFLLTVAAWLLMVRSEYASLWCAVGGAVAGVVCICRLGRGLMRDVAITSVIASGVLLLVFALFYFGIGLLLGSL